MTQQKLYRRGLVTLLLGITFVVPLLSTATTTYFWSSSPGAYFNTVMPIGTLPFGGFGNDTYGAWGTDFTEGMDFISVNFIDLRMSFDPTLVAGHGSDKIYVNVCSIPAGGSNANSYSRCSGGGSYSIATTTGYSLTSFSDAGVSTSTWKRFVFPIEWSWTWGTSTDLVFYLRCMTVSGGSCATGEEFELGYRTPEIITGYTGASYVSSVAQANGEPFVRVGRDDQFLLVSYPIQAYVVPDFDNWGVYIATSLLPDVAVGSTSPNQKLVVNYGHVSSGSYQYTDTVINPGWGNAVGLVPKSQNLDITPNATTTWYVDAELYQDDAGDGTYSTLVATAPEVSFGVSDYLTNQFGKDLFATSTYFGSLYNGYKNPATTTVASTCNAYDLICHTLTYLFIPTDCVIVNGETVCNSIQRFATMGYALQNKMPWGYVGLFRQEIYDFASITNATTSKLFDASGYVNLLSTTTLAQFKTGVSILAWVVSIIGSVAVVKAIGL